MLLQGQIVHTRTRTVTAYENRECWTAIEAREFRKQLERRAGDAFTVRIVSACGAAAVRLADFTHEDEQ